MNIIVAIIASLIIIFQNSYTFLFSIKEGISADSFLSLLPALVALTVLWSAYVFFRQKNYKYRAVTFLFCNILIIGILEFFLPISPFKTSYESKIQQKAINATVVRDVIDEVLLSENNNPIGIRIKYTTQVPVDGVYNIYPSAFTPKDKTLEPYQVQMGVMKNILIEPAPSEAEDRPGMRQFKANTIYHFVVDFVPTFLLYDGIKKNPCINFQPSTNFTETDFKNWIDKNTGTQYQTYIEIGNGNSFTTRVLAKDFVTSNSYTVKDFYQSALKEGAAECSF